MTRFMAGLAGIALAAFSAGSHAASCGVDGGAATQVRAGSELISGSAYIEDCRSLEVVHGPVNVCYVDRLLRRVCKSFNSGERLAPNDAVNEPSSGLLALFQALPIQRTGGSRGVGSNFPTGLVWPQGGDLIFNLSSGTVKASVIDAESNKVLVEAAKGADRLIVPRNILKNGRAYRWQVLGAMGLQQGDFSIPDKEEENRVSRLLEQVVPSGDARNAALTRAILLYESGYEFDAQQLMD